MTGDCRLAGVREISIQVAGSQLLIRVSGMALEAGESGRIEEQDPGNGTAFRVLACPDPDAQTAQVVTLEARFEHRPGVQAVEVAHAGGSHAVTLEQTIVCPVCGRTNPATRTFCFNCGSFLHPATAVPAPAPGPSAAPSSPPSAPPPPPPPASMAPQASVPQMDASEMEPINVPMPDMAETAAPDMAAPDMAAPETEAIDLPPMATDEPVGADAPMAAADDEPAPEPTTAAAPGDEPAPDDDAEATAAEAPGEPAAPLSAKPRFPRLDAPEAAIVGTPFDVTIGVSASQDPNVAGGALQLPERSDPFVLSVQLIADGFSLADGTDIWEFDLAVTPRQQLPSVTVKLVADPIQGDGKVGRLRLLYTVDGQVIGQAERVLAVVNVPAAAADVELPDVAVRRAMALPVGATAADLTVVIMADPDAEGRLLWAFRTPHPVATPKQDIVTRIGTKAEKFADDMRKLAEGAEGKPFLRETLVGIGREIAKHVDPVFWQLFRDVSAAAAAAGGRPTILLLLEEPHVPWELAVLPEAEFPGEPRTLATEAVIGRWVLTDGPKLPPPELVEMRDMAVVFGEYKIAALKKLAEAEEEMKQLGATYAATPVHASLGAVKKVFGGDPPADVLHFAIHGRFSSAGADLLMEDGQPLTSTAILGSNLAASLFVFLNACQVGAANALLGGYAGLVAAFTARGAAAAIAPLWSVSDVVAKDLSLRFYVNAFAGERPAEVLRQEREKFAADPDPASATPMAYQFYGHPAFRLTRA